VFIFTPFLCSSAERPSPDVAVSRLRKPALRFRSAIFAIFFRSNFFWKAPFFAIFRQQQSAIYRRISLREKKCRFSRKISRKTGSTQLTAQNWTIFRRVSHREKYNFSPHFAPRKKVPFFAKKIAKNRLDPSFASPQAAVRATA
jgi:hypothetical protein